MAVRRVTRTTSDTPEGSRLRTFLTFLRDPGVKQSDPLIKRKIKIDRQLNKLKVDTENGPVRVIE